jgi:hypothetical protein
MEIEDRWDISYTIEPIIDPKYSKKITITIKNHSPYLRSFRITIEKINIEDNLTNLRFRMYFNLINPVTINIEKYKKECIELKIPRFEYREKDSITISIENIAKKEKRSIEIFLK